MGNQNRAWEAPGIPRDDPKSIPKREPEKNLVRNNFLYNFPLISAKNRRTIQVKTRLQTGFGDDVREHCPCAFRPTNYSVPGLFAKMRASKSSATKAMKWARKSIPNRGSRRRYHGTCSGHVFDPQSFPKCTENPSKSGPRGTFDPSCSNRAARSSFQRPESRSRAAQRHAWAVPGGARAAGGPLGDSAKS